MSDFMKYDSLAEFAVDAQRITSDRTAETVMGNITQLTENKMQVTGRVADHLLEQRVTELERRIEEQHAWIPLLLKRIGRLEAKGEQE